MISPASMKIIIQNIFDNLWTRVRRAGLITQWVITHRIGELLLKKQFATNQQQVESRGKGNKDHQLQNQIIPYIMKGHHIFEKLKSISHLHFCKGHGDSGTPIYFLQFTL